MQTGKEISNSTGNYYNNNNSSSAVSTTTLKNVVNDNEKVQFPKTQQQQQHPDSVLSTVIVLKGRVYDIGNDSNRNKHVEGRAG
jgi:hypothetical protein